MILNNWKDGDSKGNTVERKQVNWSKNGIQVLHEQKCSRPKNTNTSIINMNTSALCLNSDGLGVQGKVLGLK